MLLTDTCPSWLYEVKAGATTMWERWDALREDGSCNLGEDNGSGGMVSFNHYANGHQWEISFYRRISGNRSCQRAGTEGFGLPRCLVAVLTLQKGM